MERGPRQIPANERAAIPEQRPQLARQSLEERTHTFGVRRHFWPEWDVRAVDILRQRRSHDEEVADGDRCSVRCEIVPSAAWPIRRLTRPQNAVWWTIPVGISWSVCLGTTSSASMNNSK
jgi:hypothetical protein